MAQNYYWSPSTLAFYPVSLLNLYKSANSFPSDAVLVDDTVFETYSGNPPSGQTRGASNGMPAWIYS